MRVRIDGKDALINLLGCWDDPVEVAGAQAISVLIWSDYQKASFDRSLMADQPLINGKQVDLLEALRVRAESKLQAAAIHVPKLLDVYEPYGLVFVVHTSHRNVFDHLLGCVWKLSLQRCG